MELPPLGDPEEIFTLRERARFARLGPRRRPSFLGARLALKNLARSLDRVGPDTDLRQLETLHPDGVLPALPGAQGDPPLRCSVAHDSRFAVAVAAPLRVGVDVEHIAARVERVARVFVNAREADLLARSGPRRRADLTKLWTIKEAVTKALGLPLTQAFEVVRLTELGTRESRFSLDERIHRAHHAQVADHIFTLVQLPD